MMPFHLRSRHLSEISDVSQSSLKGPAYRAGYRERSRCSSSARDAPGGDRPSRSGPVRVRVGLGLGSGAGLGFSLGLRLGLELERASSASTDRSGSLGRLMLPGASSWRTYRRTLPPKVPARRRVVGAAGRFGSAAKPQRPDTLRPAVLSTSCSATEGRRT
eukprot:scaffold32037_cov66-Phaeocystis_antarctica.AAC.1